MAAPASEEIAGVRFRRQFALGPYIVDFVCLPAGLVVEVGGGQHAGNHADERRMRWLQAQGFMVLRFWNAEVLQNTEGVVETISNATVERLSAHTTHAADAPSPNPSREGRGTR